MQTHFTVSLTCAGLLVFSAIAQAQQPKTKSADEPPAAGERPRRDDPNEEPRRTREPRGDEPYGKSGKRPDGDAPPPGKAGPRGKGGDAAPFPQPFPPGAMPGGAPGGYGRSGGGFGGYPPRPGEQSQGYGGGGGGPRFGYGSGGMMPGPQMNTFGEPPPDDPEMRELMKQDAELEQQSHSMAQRLRETSGEERKQLKDAIAKTVTKHFEVRQARRELQIKRMEEELKRLRETIAKRNDSKNVIIEGRFRELTDEPRDLDF